MVNLLTILPTWAVLVGSAVGPAPADTIPTRTRVDLSRYVADRPTQLFISPMTGQLRRLAQSTPTDQVTLARGDFIVIRVPNDAPTEANPAAPMDLGAVAVAAEPNPTTEAAAGATRFVLPLRIVTVDPATDEPLYLRPVIETVGRGLQMGSDGSTRFVGRVRLGLQDTVSPGKSVRLARAVQFELGGQIDEATPSNLEVSHTNLPYSDAMVFVGSSELPDSIRLQVRSSLGGDPVDLVLAVLRPNLVLSGPDEALGFGLERAEFTVQAPPGASDAQWVVTVHVSRGVSVPNRLTLASGEAGAISVRSSGVGPVVVSADSPLLGSGSHDVRYSFPFAFLIFAGVGGAVGGLLTAARQKRRGGRGKLLVAGLTGVGTGLVVAVAYTVGLNVLGLTFGAQSGEALVFTLAALGGVAGPAILGSRQPLGSAVAGGSSDTSV